MAEISNRRLCLVVFIAAFWVVWPAKAAQEAAPAPPAGTFLSISDIHFDPFYDQSLVPKLEQAEVEEWKEIFAGSQVTAVSTYGSDVNYPLLRSTLAALRSADPQPDFILISGDFLGHGFNKYFQKQTGNLGTEVYQSFVRKTIGFVALQLREAFPGVPIYPALGNNDSYCGDYQTEPAGPFLAALREIWRPLIGSAAGTFDETFPLGGFYSVPHPTVPRQRIVVLSSIFFSPKYQNACGSAGDPAALQLGWLAYTLQRAALTGETVWIVEHIPPGIDVFSTLYAKGGTCQTNPVPLWQAEALSSYQQILAAAPGTVAASFAGHTHIDDFRLPAGVGFVHGTPAVSPIYNNNPGFQVFTYDRASGALADFRTYYLDVSAAEGTPWAMEYDFQQTYNQSAYNAATLQSVQQAIVNDPVVRGLFLTYYPVRSQKGSIDPQSWKAYACGITSSTPADFASCYCTQ